MTSLYYSILFGLYEVDYNSNNTNNEFLHYSVFFESFFVFFDQIIIIRIINSAPWAATGPPLPNNGAYYSNNGEKPHYSIIRIEISHRCVQLYTAGGTLG